MVGGEQNPIVQWRLENGSLCHLCPLNGMPRVAPAGRYDASVVILGTHATPDDVGPDGMGQYLWSKAGWVIRKQVLGKAVGGDWLAMPIIMCPLKRRRFGGGLDDIGRRALACCRRSAIAFLAHLAESKPRALVPCGNIALGVLQGKSTAVLAGMRGTVNYLTPIQVPEETVIKVALKGLKPPSELAPHLKLIKAIMAAQRKALGKPPRAAQEVLKWVDVLIKRQRKSLTQSAHTSRSGTGSRKRRSPGSSTPCFPAPPAPSPSEPTE